MADTMDEEELDTRSGDVLVKYKAAGEVANNVLLSLVQSIQPGQNIVEICTQGDTLIETLTKNQLKKVKSKGVAFPTCVSVNNCVGHLSPLPEDPAITVKEGDLIKIDLGVHFDGFISQCAHTFILGQNPEQGPAQGKLGDVICACYFASECVHRLLRPGKSNLELTQIVRKIADAFHCNPVEGVLSHQVKQNIIDGNNVIINRTEVDQQVEEFKFEVYQTYVIDIVISSGEGKTRELGNRTTVFKRAVDRNYMLKLQTSRTLLGEINKKFHVLPFTLRALSEKSRRLGIVEIVKHELVDSYPVLWEKEGEFVAQFKFTALILPNETVRLNSFPLPHVTSLYSVDNIPEITSVLQLSTAKKKNKPKKKKKKPATANAAAEGPVDDNQPSKMDTDS